MTNNPELTAADFDAPTPETLADMAMLFGDINQFIEDDPRGHVQEQTWRPDGAVTNRFIVIRRTQDAAGRFDFNANTFEKDGTILSVTLSLSKDSRSYTYFDEPEDGVYALDIDDRSQPRPATPDRNNPAAVVMGSLQQMAEDRKTGVSTPTQGKLRELITVTREIMGRAAAQSLRGKA